MIVFSKLVQSSPDVFHRFKLLSLLAISSVACLLLHQQPIIATNNTESFFTKNNILFYDPKDSNVCTNSGTSVSLGNLELTEQGKQFVDSYMPTLRQKLAEIVEADGTRKSRQQRYVEAAKQAGLPEEAWMLLATVDYRERNWNTTKTILNGRDSFGASRGTDGIPPGKNYQDDLVKGAEVLAAKARAAGFDLRDKNQWNTDNIGNIFLQWVRGGLYKSVNLTWRDSGYVMNFLTAYKYPGKLDSPGYCAKTNELNRRHNTTKYHCDHSETRMGALVMFKVLNDSLTGGGLKLGSGNALKGNINCSSAPGGVNSSLWEVYQKYAWPEHCKARVTNLPGCDANTPKAGREYTHDPVLLQYQGANHGQDCGAWARFAMIKSGIDPNYGSGSGWTVSMRGWFPKQANWQVVGNGSTDVSQLQSGDVALCSGHTYFYVGNGIFSSASMNTRYPMRGRPNECGLKPMRWWRKVK